MARIIVAAFAVSVSYFIEVGFGQGAGGGDYGGGYNDYSSGIDDYYVDNDYDCHDDNSCPPKCACSNTCTTANDGVCDYAPDYCPRSVIRPYRPTSYCELGTDCSDCGLYYYCPSGDCSEIPQLSCDDTTGTSCPGFPLPLTLGLAIGIPFGILTICLIIIFRKRVCECVRRCVDHKYCSCCKKHRGAYADIRLESDTYGSTSTINTREHSSLKEWVDAGPASNTGPGPQFPSGSWRGYYHQYGRNHSLFAFDLSFAFNNGVEGTVEGAGSDEVGRYHINGHCNCKSGRLGFVKKYIRGTGDRRENKGHSVIYKGDVQGSLAAGVRGKWSVKTYSYSGTGNFHIWPECQPLMPEKGPIVETKTDAITVPIATEVLPMALPMGIAFAADNNNECVVCFCPPVETCLRPCGHVAICKKCAKCVKKCPICREPIECVEAIAVAKEVI